MKNINLIFLLLIIVAGVAAFFGGMYYQQSNNTAQRNLRNFGNQTQQLFNTLQGNGDFFSGSIISKSADSISLRLSGAAGSRYVFFSDSTKIIKLSSVAPSNFSVGQNVGVAGVLNTDGTIVAQYIQIEPQTQQAIQQSGN